MESFSKNNYEHKLIGNLLTQISRFSLESSNICELYNFIIKLFNDRGFFVTTFSAKKCEHILENNRTFFVCPFEDGNLVWIGTVNFDIVIDGKFVSFYFNKKSNCYE